MFAERLERARKAAGLSMSALASEVGLSANAIKKYEHGTTMPSSSNLLKLAKALDVRTEYFFRPTKVKLEGVEYRKRASTPKKMLDRINGDVLDQAERWQELLELYPDSVKPIPEFALPDELPQQITSLEQAEDLAIQMRHAWDLGLNPIHDMIDTLEAKGVMIITTDVETNKKFDGLAGKIGSTPVVVISTAQSGDRQRFTLAHELGHLVVHGRLVEGIDEEKVCNAFAGAFLLPAQTLIEHLGEKRRHIEPRELFMLKHEYGISMLAALFRAGQCGIITSATQKSLFMLFSKNGWRTQEPGKAYPHESTYLHKQLVYRALGEEYIGESKAAELLGMSVSSFHKERKLEAPLKLKLGQGAKGAAAFN
ncbi:helix-turn-helix domain-containing protein [Shewanella colwelliana]|uniref:helix-turn-helix domain-containing protein n=1 Tax=Shewanella colwelliana TaxID=23 RepID=UPI0022AF9CB7|nr:XRE family transcriptional regulator [Shewanella colwelliana]MCZ4337884.1 XRE family transcriptional regulator [Shewanella colwelliana]